MSDESNTNELDVSVTAKKDELSLKAKGAGLIILIAICLIGIILLALKMADKETNVFIIMPIIMLSYITYNLIATMDAVLGLTVRVRD
ncbi:hypothetical protein [Enterovibrio norvegicus]|uniref:Uncharacterized protein n=1 Tax=Enterovibrio norvegicus TaxID=188144 RepID=A0ABV4L7U5_9GAMM|nr:hypothetical protein [Enterovibrio norvegicus]OEF55148.1 hypothetical protein A1OU_22470 [Enterovibrio norvegicus]